MALFLSSDNRILYSNLKKENIYQNIVDSQPVKDFYATIDKNGTIRILAYTLSRQLVYYEWFNKRWERQILERVYSRFQNISYISILSSSTNIHILYYIESSLTKSAESLVHYYLQDEKWYGGRVWKFISDESTTMRTAFIDSKDDLHIIFTKRKKNEGTNFFHARFHSNLLSWTGPSHIHTSTGSCEQLQLYVDMDENIYLVWKESIDNIYWIKYLYQIKGEPVPSWSEATLYQSSHEISSPTLVHRNELLCLWKENNILYQIKSLDSGKSWSRPHSLTENPGEQLNLFHFISYNKNKFPSHSINLWGQGYPDIRLAGIDWYDSSQGTHFPKPSLQPDYSSQLAEIREAISLINNEIKQTKTQLGNLSSQVNQLYSAVYELQEQFNLKEKSIFAIQTEIKRLGFEIRKIQQRPKQISNIESVKKNTTSIPDKLEANNSIESDTEEQSTPSKSEQSTENSKKTEKITLGNTTIIINPEDSEV